MKLDPNNNDAISSVRDDLGDGSDKFTPCTTGGTILIFLIKGERLK